jgi:hypothetical protein
MSSISQSIFYVYAYMREDGTPWYIGKGSGERAFRHQAKESIQPPRDKSRIIFLEKNLTELGAFAIERRMIRWYGRIDIGTGILHNKSDGGDGSSGYRHTQRAKKSIKESNEKTWRLPETIKRYRESMENVWDDANRNSKIGKAISGKNNPMFGKEPANKLHLTAEERKEYNRQWWKNYRQKQK